MTTNFAYANKCFSLEMLATDVVWSLQAWWLSEVYVASKILQQAGAGCSMMAPATLPSVAQNV